MARSCCATRRNATDRTYTARRPAHALRATRLERHPVTAAARRPVRHPPAVRRTATREIRRTTDQRQPPRRPPETCSATGLDNISTWCGLPRKSSRARKGSSAQIRVIASRYFRVVWRRRIRRFRRSDGFPMHVRFAVAPPVAHWKDLRTSVSHGKTTRSRSHPRTVDVGASCRLS